MRRPTLAGPAILIFVVIAAVAAACSGGGSDSVPPAMSTEPTRTVSVPTLATTSQPVPAATSEITGPIATVGSAPISAGDIEAGRELFTGSGGCAACHTIDSLAHGVLGPDLTNVASVAGDRVVGYSAEQYLRESIVDSCAYTVPDTDCILMLNVMNSIVLSDADVDALVAFLLQQR